MINLLIDTKSFLPSEKFLCVATILQLILEAEGYTNVSRYAIAEYFGVNVPLGYKIETVGNIKEEEDIDKLGIIIKDNQINNCFHYFNIKLKETYHSIHTIGEMAFTLFLETNLHDNYLVCGFDYGKLYNIPEAYNLGHVSLICNYTPNDDLVTLFDPGPNEVGYKTVKADDLYRSICGKNDGVWLINKPNI